MNCLCGCGNTLKSNTSKYISGHNMFSKRLTGRGWSLNNGYKRISFRGINLGKYEHNVVMENYLGRKLIKGEIVHHKNGNKLDNRINNLELMTISQHMKEHYPNRKLNSLGQFI